jgi:LysM repeat protein
MEHGAAPHGRRGIPRQVVPAALIALLASVIVVVVTSTGGSNPTSSSSSQPGRVARKLPPFWTVRSGETYSRIARRTGLSVAQLEALNPTIDPYSLVPGERLRLRAYTPRPQHKRLGPRYWTVRAGESFGSIAAKTGKSIVALEQLNPRLKPTELQPGDTVKLRR